jgi:Tfp pilus assembly protein PilX
MLRRRNEGGFALVAALLANLILLAVGIIALNLSSQDIRVSVRTMADKKAVTAAETGVHRLALDFISEANIPALTGKVYNDFSSDSGTKATVVSIVKNPNSVTAPSMPGYQIGGTVSWSQEVYQVEIKGENTRYNSVVNVVAGFGHGPAPGSGTGY